MLKIWVIEVTRVPLHVYMCSSKKLTCHNFTIASNLLVRIDSDYADHSCLYWYCDMKQSQFNVIDTVRFFSITSNNKNEYYVQLPENMNKKWFVVFSFQIQDRVSENDTQ